MTGQRDGRLEYFENTGTSAAATFTARTGAANLYDSVVLPTNSVHLATAFGDVDGDGDLDLIVGSNLATFAYFKDERTAPTGSGSGTEQPSATVYRPLATNPLAGITVPGSAAPSLADLDGDGDLDLVVGSSGPTNDGAVRVYMNTPSGFVRDMTSTYDGIARGSVGGRATRSSRPVIVDLDQDGDLDMVVGNVIESPVFGELTYYQFIGPGLSLRREAGFSDPFGNAFGGGSPIPTFGDVDGDGDLDLVIRNAGAIEYWENTATSGVFSGTQRTGAANPFDVQAGIIAPHLADVDGDGDVDLVGSSPGGILVYLENVTVAGQPLDFTERRLGANPFRSIGALAPGGTPFPVLGNLDADPELELVLGNTEGGLTVYDLVPSTPTLSVQLNGAAGWRMVASPDPTATLDLLVNDPLWIQGMPDGDIAAGAPTWSAGTRRRRPTPRQRSPRRPGGGRATSSTSTKTTTRPRPARSTAAFPKCSTCQARRRCCRELRLPGTLVHARRCLPGFNLLGNPTATWFDWDAADRTDLNATVFVYDPAIANYRTYTSGVGGGASPLAGGIVGPFQAFWAQTQSASAALTVRPALSNGGPFLGRGVAGPATLAIRIRPADGSGLPAGIEGGTLVALGVADALDGFGPEDAVALAPPASAYVTLSSVVASDDGPLGLAVDLRPDLAGRVEIPMRASVVGAAGAQPLVIDWPEMRDVPQEWTVTLTDRQTGASVDLRTATEYAFTAEGTAALGDPLAALTPPSVAPAVARGDVPRFTLVVQSASTAGEDGAEALLALDAPRPNPATSRSDLPFSVDAAGRVRVSVYDVLGREVAVVTDGERAAGAHTEALDVTRLAPGVYVVRLSTATGTRVRTLTVVR